jgi:dTDP-glucose 4,6-dehydratase
MTFSETGLGNLLKSDLDHMLNLSEHSFRALTDSRILFTGGSGFVGKWLLSSLLHANKTFGLGMTFVVISRSKTRLLNELRLEDLSQIEVWEVDLQSEPDSSSPYGHGYSHMIHLATPTTKASGNDDVANLKSATINGLRLMINLAEKSISPPTLLHTSSGAVYGQEARLKKFIDETEVVTDPGALTEYGTIKLEAEEFVKKSTHEGKINGTNPRLFTFFGPHLSYDDYAIGNFLRDVTTSDVIKVKGHPQSRRSYLYPTDLVDVLLQLLVSPVKSPFNVGSKDEVTMAELASEIASHFMAKKIMYSLEDQIPNYYVPSIKTIEDKFNFTPSITLSEGIQKWIWWKKIQDLRNFTS